MQCANHNHPPLQKSVFVVAAGDLFPDGFSAGVEDRTEPHRRRVSPLGRGGGGQVPSEMKGHCFWD